MQINANKLIDFLFAPQGSLESLQIPGDISTNKGEFLKFSELLAGLTGDLDGLDKSEKSFMALSAEELNFLSGMFPGLKTGEQNLVIIPLLGSDNGFGIKQGQNPALTGLTNNLAEMTMLSADDTVSEENILSGFSKIKGQGVSFDVDVAAESIVKEGSSLSSEQSKTANGISVKTALKMNNIEGSLISTTNSLAQAEKGGLSSFQELVTLSDLENLKPDESLTEVISSQDKEDAAEISFTKRGSEQSFDNKGFTRFEVLIKSGQVLKAFDAALIKDNSSVSVANYGVDELLRQVEQANGQKAQLVLFQSETELTINKIANIANPNNSGLNEQIQNLNGLIFADASVQIRKLHLQNVQTQPKNQTVVTGNVENGGHLVEAIVADDANPKFGNPLLNQSPENGKNLNSNLRSSDVFKMDVLLEGGSEMRTDSQDLRSNTDFIKSITTNSSSNTRQPELHSPVEFKLEMPRGGEKIPESGYFRIKIQPESLGKIDVQLKVIGNQMVARMTVETPLARQVVDSNLGQLKETLQENGIKVESITVDVSTNSDKNNEQFDNHQLASHLRQRIRFNNANIGFTEADQAGQLSAQMNRSTNLKGSMSLLA